MDLSLTSIYAHLEPFEDEVRYIGKSNKPEARLRAHLREANVCSHRHANWLRSLKARGLEPRLEIIAEVPDFDWEFWEQHFIRYFRECGFDLTNILRGGEGLGSGPAHPCFGKPLTSEHKQKISIANSNKPKSVEHRAALSQAQKIAQKTASARRRTQNISWRWSPAQCNARSLLQTGKKRGLYKKKKLIV